MSRSLLLLAVLVIGCDDGEPDAPKPPPGALEYEGMVNEFYRLERRVDLVPVDGLGTPRCGVLTERAFREIEDTIQALDSSVDYAFEASGEDCLYSENPAAWIHVPGFEHSPFHCDEYCCHPDLAPVARVYFHVGNNLAGEVIEQDGEPYVAIEPDKPCS